ncbi:MAG: hypothetical protein Q7R69_00035 [bacterium]|nr:hypothetical protein [bacterium]
MRILIVTGIYPPEIGGPAEYALNLKDTWVRQGHKVKVKIFGRFRKIPWGIRHVIFLVYILPSVMWSDCIFTLDAFTAGVSTVASKLFNKKNIFRTGGDALWELYVERTNDLVLLRDFYRTRLKKLSVKEKVTFHLMKWALRNLSAIIWSTEWQKNIFMEPYHLSRQNHFIVENYYGPKLESRRPATKNFIAGTRKLKWKNIVLVQKVFEHKDTKESGAILDTSIVHHDEFLNKLSQSYAVIIASLGDISPNTILDAIRCGKPFILTRENGLYSRIKDIGLFVDPQDEEDIKSKVLWLVQEGNYASQKAKIDSFSFSHTWEEIAGEYITAFNSIK